MLTANIDIWNYSMKIEDFEKIFNKKAVMIKK